MQSSRNLNKPILPRRGDSVVPGWDWRFRHDSLSLMGGAIAVESEVGKGSKFTFEMHLKPAPEGTEASAAQRNRLRRRDTGFGSGRQRNKPKNS